MLVKTPALKVGDNCANVGAIVTAIQYHPATRNYTISFRGSLRNFEIVASRSRNWVI
jgi:hypothetical protein